MVDDNVKIEVCGRTFVHRGMKTAEDLAYAVGDAVDRSDARSLEPSERAVVYETTYANARGSCVRFDGLPTHLIAVHIASVASASHEVRGAALSGVSIDFVSLKS